MIFHNTYLIQTLIGIYADDTALWTANENVDMIQQHLQASLDSVCDWLAKNNMIPNTKKTKKLLISKRQNLKDMDMPSLNLILNGNLLQKADKEKLLGVRSVSTST